MVIFLHHPLYLEMLYAYEYKALDEVGLDVHIQAYRERMEFDTKKFPSSLCLAKEKSYNHIILAT